MPRYYAQAFLANFIRFRHGIMHLNNINNYFDFDIAALITSSTISPMDEMGFARVPSLFSHTLFIHTRV
jgi:hypothetical protein